MTLFLVLGATGLVGLIVGLLVGDIDVDLGPDWLSLPALAALVGAFGFVGAASLGFGAPLLVAVVVGTVAGVVLAAATVRLAQALIHMPTDASPRSSDLVGQPGRVVTALVADRPGEILVTQAGQQVKVAARAEHTITVGEAVVVVEVLSPTLVRVEAHDLFWASGDRPAAEPPTLDPDPDPHPDDPTPHGGTPS